MTTNRNAGIGVCAAVAVLIMVGFVMLASTSVWARENVAPYFHVKRQAMWLMIGLIAATGCALLDYRKLRRWWPYLLGGSCVLLALVYVPSLQYAANGEARWLKLPGGIRFQPSETAKIATMLALAGYLTQYQAESRSFLRGFVVSGAILAVPVGLIFFETDMGTAACLGAAGTTLLFVGGVKLRYLLLSFVLATSVMTVVVMQDEGRKARVAALFNPEEHADGKGWQQQRASIAFANGGVLGLGLGNGAEKRGYLPFAHTDFIFAMVGEELGLITTLTVVGCFVLLLLCGTKVAVSARDQFGRLLAIGLVASVLMPAILNMGVVTGIFPNSGLPLPFVSYGGSNLVFTLSAIGLLVSIQRHNMSEKRVRVADVKQHRLAARL